MPGADFLRADLFKADLFKADLFKADLEREFIVWETCVQQSRRQAGASRFKRALIGFGQSAPIRDR
ncbi:pentapeptide repeat-containing protein [Bradyrhizobium yuanmingense]|uniref:pentapeptide repeat-containing protein n=1 Tax=Bradyrhizobium yuanmingense TaxID=108015 RepID=UPI0035141BC5